MKAFFLIIIHFISISYGQTSKNYLNSQNKIIAEEKEAFVSVENTKNTSQASLNFKVNYYRCEWNVNPAVRFIAGKVTSYFKITVATDNISFDLTDSLTVDSVKQINTSAFICSFEQYFNDKFRPYKKYR